MGVFLLQNHPKLYGDGKDLIDYGMSAFGMSPTHWSALQGIHGIVDFIFGPGTKYTWFGSGYISNTYFKQIANKPMYKGERGDLSFTDCFDDGKSESLFIILGIRQNTTVCFTRRLFRETYKGIR